MDPEEMEWRRFWIEAWEEEKKNVDAPLKDYTYSSFISRSAGKNKRRRRYVEVELIGIGRGKHVSLKNGRFPKTKRTRMDCIAEEALGDSCPPNINPLDHFLNVLRQRERRSKEKSRG